MRAYMLLLITVAAFIAESVKHWSVSVRPSVRLSVSLSRDSENPRTEKPESCACVCIAALKNPSVVVAPRIFCRTSISKALSTTFRVYAR